nr:coiled-coil-helix-coiled-coil-helix domain-containing protein 1 isoform X1 [Paramormyrops kingsleyae]
MSSQGIALQQKLSLMLSKTVGKPVLKPNKPLALKDEVANRKMKKGEATCIMEMSLLMACWKENEFNNALCSSEVQTFFKCAEKAEGNSPTRVALCSCVFPDPRGNITNQGLQEKQKQMGLLASTESCTLSKPTHY